MSVSQIMTLSLPDYQRVEQNITIAYRLIELAEKKYFDGPHQDFISILSLLLAESVDVLSSIENS